MPATQTTYSPEKPLADSLGELAVSIAEIPPSFEVMSTQLGSADDNLDSLKGSLETMSQSVSRISDSLEEYQAMISQSEASMGDINTLLNNVQSNLDRILTVITVVLVLFFLWLLAAQVVIFSQGYELFHGTAAAWIAERRRLFRQISRLRLRRKNKRAKNKPRARQPD